MLPFMIEATESNDASKVRTSVLFTLEDILVKGGDLNTPGRLTS